MCTVVSDRSLGPQLQGHWWDLRGVLERHWGQSRCQRIRRLGMPNRLQQFAAHLFVSFFRVLCQYNQLRKCMSSTKRTRSVKKKKKKTCNVACNVLLKLPYFSPLGLCSWSPKIADVRLWWWILECAANCLLLTSANKLSLLEKSRKVEWNKTSLPQQLLRSRHQLTPVYLTVCRCVFYDMPIWNTSVKRSPKLDWIQLPGCIHVLKGF